MKLNKENGMKGIFFLAALTSVLAVALICIFLLAGGLPAMAKIGFGDFIFGRKWKPGNNIFGIFPMIMGSACVTGVSLAIGVPIALFTSMFMAFYCPKKIYRLCQAAINLMAGVPSIVYGFFGLMLIVPMMNRLTGEDGSTMLTASIVLAIMILPTIIAQAETALRSVPDSYYEGALALGATKERSLFAVVLPAAKSGVIAGVVLGIGRAIGETMAVVMVAGNQTWMPSGLLKGVRTLTANIVMEMGYATDLHREALIATGVVLFVFILVINLAVSMLNRRTIHE